MITKQQKIRLGIFITTAIIILLAVVLALSMKRLFQKKDVYYISYKNVSITGLDVGSSVKYLGINVGNVKNIKIDPKDISRIIVTIAIKQGTPIKSDLQANISTLGITGIKVIELRGGTNEAQLLKPGSFIKPGKSLTEQITGKAEVIGEKVELLLNNLNKLTNTTNRNKVLKIVDRISSISDELDLLLKENRPKINSSFTKLDTTLSYLSATGRAVKKTSMALEAIARSDSLRGTLRSIAQIADKLNKSNIYNLDKQLNLSVSKLNHLLSQADRAMSLNLTQINRSVETLNEAIRHLNSAARQIDENPAILLGGSQPKNPPDEKLEQ